MKQHFSYFEELFDTQQYLLMTNNIQELLKIARNFKKFFQDILSKQLELSQSNLRNAQKLVDRNKEHQFPLSLSFQSLGKTVEDLFSGVQDGNLQQSQTLYQYEARVEDQIGKILRHKDEYIQSSIQYYKNDEQTYKKNLISLQNRIQKYKEQLTLYQQALNDPSMLYNYNLKQQRYTELQQKMKRIREKEQKIQTSLEVLNTRRKSLCVDLKELRDIIEQGFSEIIVETHQLCCNNIENLKQKLEQFIFHRKRPSNFSTKYQYSILPVIQKGIINQNYKRIYSDKPQNYNYVDDSIDTISNYEEISFRSIKTPSQSMQTIQEPYEIVQFPDFILQDFTLMPQSILTSFYDQMIVYTKNIKENCDQNNGIILSLLQFIESLITQFRKQGKACIKQPDFKQNYFSQLKWFESFSKIFGEQGYDDLYAYTSINDLFNLYINKFLIILQEQQKSILQVQNKIQQQLAVTFGSIDAQMQELQTVHWNYQRSLGIVNNQNQAVGLQKIDQQKIEQQFKQFINQSNKAIRQLIEQLNFDLSKNYKTINAIANSIEASFSRDLQEIMKFNHQLQEPQELKKKARDQIIKFLKSQKSFSIFYKQKVTKNKVLLMLDDLQSDKYDLQYSSENDFVQMKSLPKPGLSIESDQQVDEDIQSQAQSEISSNEKDKDKIAQMQFIKQKLKMDLNEVLISSFACALSEKIQLQGRLYITNKRLFFHSNFNSSNLFFGDTVLNVPKADILSIQKRTNAFIFDNSISVVTPKGQLFFATFFQRDIAYDIIIKTFSPKEQPELLTSNNNQNPVNQIKIINVNYTQEQLLLLQARQQRLINLMGPDPNIFVADYLFEFPLINIKLFFKLIYGDKMPGQNISFYEKMKLGPLGCDKVALTQWTPAPPMDYDSDYGTLNLVECSDFLEREFSCLQPLPKSSIPLMPTKCECKEQQKIYFLNQECFVVDLIVKTFKVPYAESFYVIVRYKYQQTDKGINFTCHISNNFIKSCMFKKVIEKAGFDEISEKTKQKIIPSIKQEINNYLMGSQNNDIDDNLQEEPQQYLKKNGFLQNKILKQLFYGISLALIILIIGYYTYSSILSKIKIKIEFEK